MAATREFVNLNCLKRERVLQLRTTLLFLVDHSTTYYYAFFVFWSWGGGGVKILKYACCTRGNCCRETLERRCYLKFSEREHINQTPFFSVHRSVRVREIGHNRIYIEICCIPSLVCMPRWANSKDRCSRLTVVTDILI